MGTAKTCHSPVPLIGSGFILLEKPKEGKKDEENAPKMYFEEKSVSSTRVVIDK